MRQIGYGATFGMHLKILFPRKASDKCNLWDNNWKEMGYRKLSSHIQGGPQKSTPQIVFGYFGK